jgi:replication fork protection complex subunit Csm3/Swi3
MAHQDELDEVLGYDAEMEEIFSNLHKPDNKERHDSTKERAASFEPENLGIDEEVKITKKRKPIAKLDSSRYV